LLDKVDEFVSRSRLHGDEVRNRPHSDSISDKFYILEKVVCDTIWRV